MSFGFSLFCEVLYLASYRFPPCPFPGNDQTFLFEFSAPPTLPHPPAFCLSSFTSQYRGTLVFILAFCPLCGSTSSTPLRGPLSQFPLSPQTAPRSLSFLLVFLYLLFSSGAVRSAPPAFSVRSFYFSFRDCAAPLDPKGPAASPFFFFSCGTT